MNDATETDIDAVAPASGKWPIPPNTGRLPARKERTPLAKTLPTDRVSCEKQMEILRAFAAEYAANGNQPVTNDRAGSIVGLSGSTVSQTNGFFNDIGIVSRSDDGTGFIPCNEAIEYNNACQWDETEAQSKLRPLFERTWFYRCLAPRLQLAIQPQGLCIALLAGESKATTEHNERLFNLLKFLEAVGIFSLGGGNVSLIQQKRLVASQKTDEQKPHAQTSVSQKEIDLDQHILFLDGKRQRTVKLTAPLVISNAEYSRICNWIKVALIIEDEKTQ